MAPRMDRLRMSGGASRDQSPKMGFAAGTGQFDLALTLAEPGAVGLGEYSERQRWQDDTPVRNQPGRALIFGLTAGRRQAWQSS